MEFEFDPAKSAANKDKHGIDFVEAQALWLDDGLADAPVVSDGEPRFLVIGRIDGKHCLHPARRGGADHLGQAGAKNGGDVL
jgi:uncharacterized DUF497 family protein